MKLSECKLGEIVILKYSHDEYNKDQVGHIVGLSRSFYTDLNLKKTYQVIPLVKFADTETPSAVHHHNLEILDNVYDCKN